MANLELSDVIQRTVEQWVLEHVYTSMPAKVISVSNYSSNQTVDIQPQIVDAYRDGRDVELPAILDVPVIMPSAGGGLLSFPIAVGDTVTAVFSRKSIDEWMNSRADRVSYIPSDRRSYHLNDAIVIPGLYTKNTNLSPNATDVELKFANSRITLKVNGDIEVDTPNNLTATAGGQADITAPTININGNCNISGNLVVTGSVSGNVVTDTATNNVLSTHTHPSNGSPPTPGT